MFGAGREAMGSVLGGVIGGMAAWAYGTMMGGILHLAWLGAAIGLLTAVFMTFALATVDRRSARRSEARAHGSNRGRSAGFELATA